MMPLSIARADYGQLCATQPDVCISYCMNVQQKRCCHVRFSNARVLQPLIRVFSIVTTAGVSSWSEHIWEKRPGERPPHSLLCVSAGL